MKSLLLNEGWCLTSENLSCGPGEAAVVLFKSEGWMKCDIPCDVHIPLINEGIIKEPVEALNCFDCEWIEEKSWWFKKVFDAGEELIGREVVELTLEALDSNADIFLNGVHLGNHNNAFYPFTAEVKQYLKKADNTLLVRVTAGLEKVSQLELSPIKNAISYEKEVYRGTRGDKRRVFVRKPQFTFGWDWGPRIASCGIMKDVYIKAYDRLVVRCVHITAAEVCRENARLDISVEVENLHPFSSFDCEVKIQLAAEDGTSAEIGKIWHLRSGINFIKLQADVAEPKLWWPNNMGGQHLYTVRASVTAGQYEAVYGEFKYGIRTLKLGMDPLKDGERLFAFEINGIKTFCKGGNWIPADSVYGRVSNEKYTALIKEAKEANFTMLRVWGGGLYEKDIFYEKCDEYGILVWQDFMFGCAMYPDRQEWFLNTVEKEMDYQTKRLRNHACLVLWCGNNENHWGFDEWWNGYQKGEYLGGAIIYNRLAPATIEKNCPEIPYWSSSPYGGLKPNGNEIGDRHHWYDCTMNTDMHKRITPEEYDKITSKFISEYGYIGPCGKSTLEKYHAGQPINREGDIWKHHNNTFEKDTVAAGIEKHYRDYSNISLEDYLLYAGLCQGLMYQYSLEAIRYKKDCWGSLFWMYNDCWGEVGWTIVDYYLVRKPSFYYVKRAFAPVKLILRREADQVMVMGVNDTDKELCFNMDYGYVTFDGRSRRTSVSEVRLQAFSRNIIQTFAVENDDLVNGMYFVKPDADGIDGAILRSGDFRRLNTGSAVVRVGNFLKNGGECSFTVKSENYAHAVHFSLGDQVRPSDEYFDLLPGECRTIILRNLPADFGIKDIKPTAVNS